MSIARGFYTYTIDERGYYEISRPADLGASSMTRPTLMLPTTPRLDHRQVRQ